MPVNPQQREVPGIFLPLGPVSPTFSSGQALDTIKDWKPPTEPESRGRGQITKRKGTLGSPSSVRLPQWLPGHSGQSLNP